jgi:LIVCS family branched-chain amino acid:cation transporter
MLSRTSERKVRFFFANIIGVVMKTKWLALSTGFALFSMFFGSGNLVFPISVGQESMGHHFLATIGILLSGVLVPFLGVLGIVVNRGELSGLFQIFGKKGLFLFSFLALALMGPFGVLARCLTVSHGALMLLFPSLSLPVCSLALCVLIFILSVKQNRIIHLLGVILTPVLLVSIAAIAFSGIIHGTWPSVSKGDALSAFKNGFFQGYQTMDLLAAFFFSQFIIRQLNKQLVERNEESQLFPVFIKASIVGIIALSSVYVVLVFLGALHAPILAGVPPQEMLGLIAMESLGTYAAPIVCAAIAFACVTTAIVLTSLFADFLKTKVCNDKLSHNFSIVITLTIGFIVSTFDFDGIAKFLGPILEAVYPGLIVLTALNIVGKLLPKTA